MKPSCAKLNAGNIANGVLDAINLQLTEPLTDEEAEKLHFVHLKGFAASIEQQDKIDKLTDEEVQNRLSALQQDFIESKVAVLNRLSEYDGFPENVLRGLRDILTGFQLTSERFDSLYNFASNYDIGNMAKEIRRARTSPEKLSAVFERFAKTFTARFEQSGLGNNANGIEESLASAQVAFLGILAVNEDLMNELRGVSPEILNESLDLSSNLLSRAQMAENLAGVNTLTRANVFFSTLLTYISPNPA